LSGGSKIVVVIVIEFGFDHDHDCDHDRLRSFVPFVDGFAGNYG